MWMHGFGGYGGGWMLLSLLPWVAVIAGVAAVVVWLVRTSGRRVSPHEAGDDALAVIKLRYARGEISREQFEQMKKDLAS